MSKEQDVYTEMMMLLDKYEKDIYFKWCHGLEQVCLINLKQPLLTRSTSTGLIAVNFNPKVIHNCNVCKVLMSPIVETRRCFFCFDFTMQSGLACIKAIMLAAGSAIHRNYFI